MVVEASQKVEPVSLSTKLILPIPLAAAYNPGIVRRLASPLKDPWFVGTVTLMGLVAGLLLGLLAIGLSRSRISGNGWSLSGNAALVVPFGVGPAIVAGGWSAMVLRVRDHPDWIRLGLISGLFGLLLVALSFLSLIVFGPGGRDLGATAAIFFGVLLYGWLLGGPIVALLIDAPDSPRQSPLIWLLLSFVLLPVSLIAGCTAGTGALGA